MAHQTADIRNIALVGHASAGKTLLAEALLAGLQQFSKEQETLRQ